MHIDRELPWLLISQFAKFPRVLLQRNSESVSC